jgi:hypothetical protein
VVRDEVGRDGRGRATGCETIVVAPRAARGFGALVGGPAGIAINVCDDAITSAAILGGPYPNTRLDGTLASAQRASVAPRVPTTLVSG